MMLLCSLSKYICLSDLLTVRISVRLHKHSCTEQELLQTSLVLRRWWKELILSVPNIPYS